AGAPACVERGGHDGGDGEVGREHVERPDAHVQRLVAAVQEEEGNRGRRQERHQLRGAQTAQQRPLYWPPPMGSRVLWRRSATAVGVYGATLLGIAGTVAAARELGTDGFGRFTVAVAAYAFFQLLLDLTVEEALVKFGFRYSTAEDWPRFRRLFEVAVAFKAIGGIAAALCLLAAAPLAATIFGRHHLSAAFLAIAALPIAQSLENVGASVFILRSRYDQRAYLQALDMGLRLAGIAIGASFGAWQACLGMVVAQAISTATLCGAGATMLRRFPRAAAAP